ncbi:MAG: patatin-like phospholipase family protein [Herbinix sp.]|nr:patatin-like phospholipase family protein [Herbinix sp.]
MKKGMVINMIRQVNNLVFEGGGILGISYLGVLDYLMQNGWTKDIKRIAGTSAGAITACITSFNLAFADLNAIAESLDYSKLPSKSALDNLDLIPEDVKKTIAELLGDINCIYRLMNKYGWYSTEYFYLWIRDVIADQFNSAKKRPPYTFSDFKNASLHKYNRPFWDLYIVGTNLSMKNSSVFSYETTPMMEVAEAVRISMSIPLFFEAVITDDSKVSDNSMTNVFCDGGAINNYPLNLFDSPRYNPYLYYGANMDTLGVRFRSTLKYAPIDNLLAYIESILHLSSYIQQEIYESNPLNKQRSIVIDTYDISPLDFNIEVNDDTYRLLYNQGYTAAKAYFNG